MASSSTPRPAPIGVRLPVPESWETAIRDYVQDRFGAGSPRSSCKTWQTALEHAARRVVGGPFEQTVHTLRDYIAGQPDWSQETRRARRTTLVMFYDWALEEGHMSGANPARMLRKVKASHPHPKPAPDDVYQRALGQAKPRERLMLRLSREMGMRRDEVARAHSEDLWADFEGGYVLNVHGKGSKIRELPVPETLAIELRRLPHGYFFPGKRDGHLSAEYVGRQIAALMGNGFTMHALRHSYATRLYSAAGDIVTVQEALGHSSPATTMHYVVTDNRARLRGLMENMSKPQTIPRAG